MYSVLYDSLNSPAGLDILLERYENRNPEWAPQSMERFIKGSFLERHLELF